MHALLRTERVLEHVFALRERGLRVAASQLVVERHIGRLAPLQVRQIRERRRRLQLVVDENVRGHRLDLVEHARHLLVLDLDEAQRRLGHALVGGENHRHRLAGEAHLAISQDRLIVERRTVIRVRNDLADILDRDDAVDALQRARGRRVDALDAPVRNG